MYQFDEDLGIDHLPLDVYEEMVNELNKNSSWLELAKYVAEQLNYSSSWIRSLEHKDPNSSTNQSPAGRLLFELNIKMCTVGVLCTLLESCELLDALSLLRLPEPLDIVIHPDYKTTSKVLSIALGDYLYLSCKAFGIPPPNYEWLHENTKLAGCNSKHLKIQVTNVSQSGQYRCNVTRRNRNGVIVEEVLSRPVTISIKPTQVVIQVQPSAFVEVKEGNDLILTCKATAHPNPEFQWFRDNVKLDGQTSNALKVHKFTTKEEGKYYCHIFNSVSEIYTQRSTVVVDLPRQKAIAKVALLIANENYEHQEKLRTPKNDVARIAQILKDLDFNVICLADLTLVQMRNAIQIFCESLLEGTYGVFYFAGHGFKMQESYMLSIDAPVQYLRKDAVCESQLLSMVLKSDPALLVVILDMCQTVPPKESNPGIHNEIPMISEYKGRKSLRNLIQAYSTSSHRPSYERINNNNGLYAMHLCKYIGKDIPVTKVFEEVGKSIDIWLTGAERKQIPIFATTVTRPFRFTDGIYQYKLPTPITKLLNLVVFPEKIIDINFKQSKTRCKVVVSPFVEPYLNLVKISMLEVDEWEVNFYNSIPTKRNNLFQIANKKECWLHNPQINKGPLVISLLKNGVPVGATVFQVNEYVPALLNELESLEL